MSDLRFEPRVLLILFKFNQISGQRDLGISNSICRTSQSKQIPKAYHIYVKPHKYAYAIYIIIYYEFLMFNMSYGRINKFLCILLYVENSWELKKHNMATLEVSKNMRT